MRAFVLGSHRALRRLTRVTQRGGRRGRAGRRASPAHHSRQDLELPTRGAPAPQRVDSLPPRAPHAPRSTPSPRLERLSNAAQFWPHAPESASARALPPAPSALRARTDGRVQAGAPAPVLNAAGLYSSAACGGSASAAGDARVDTVGRRAFVRREAEAGTGGGSTARVGRVRGGCRNVGGRGACGPFAHRVTRNRDSVDFAERATWAARVERDSRATQDRGRGHGLGRAGDAGGASARDGDLRRRGRSAFAWLGTQTRGGADLALAGGRTTRARGRWTGVASCVRVGRRRDDTSARFGLVSRAAPCSRGRVLPTCVV